MIRLLLLLMVSSIGAPLLAQSVVPTLPNEETYATVTLIKYCAKIDRQSHSLQSRVFAQVYPGLGLSSGWKEFEDREAWREAGKPKPVALVWYNEGQVVRVAITNSDDGHSYTDYCYRADGSLAQLRSAPAVENDCDQALFHCNVTLNGGLWVYAPQSVLIRGPAPEPDQIRDRDMLDFFSLRMLKPEKSTFLIAPMRWPAFRHVANLPFSNLLYVCTGK